MTNVIYVYTDQPNCVNEDHLQAVEKVPDQKHPCISCV